MSRNTIADRLSDLRQELPTGVRLVAVSKFHPVEMLQEAYDAGQRVFGESRVQELVQKAAQMPKDVEWHFIGHLQRNKVRQIAPFIALIHSVDSPELLAEIERQAALAGRTIPCLLELHVAQEAEKFGFTPDAALQFLREGEWRQLAYVQLRGLMCMATFTDDTDEIRREFQLARRTFEQAKTECFADAPAFRELSMGMTDDYPVAIEEGSTMVRIGTKLFGPRNY